MKALTTTLNKIRAHHPCESGWKTLLKHLGKTDADDEPLLFSVIAESNGLNDAVWCMRAAPEHGKEWRLFAVWCARSVSHLMADARSLAAIDVAEKFALGYATENELAAARYIARDVAKAASDACAARAAWAASAAQAASAAWAACAARAACAASAAGDACAARDVASAACAASAASAAQKTEFLRIVSGEQT